MFSISGPLVKITHTFSQGNVQKTPRSDLAVEDGARLGHLCHLLLSMKDGVKIQRSFHIEPCWNPDVTPIQSYRFDDSTGHSKEIACRGE